MFLVVTTMLLINIDVKIVLRQPADNDTQIAGNRKITSTVIDEFTVIHTKINKMTSISHVMKKPF